MIVICPITRVIKYTMSSNDGHMSHHKGNENVQCPVMMVICPITRVMQINNVQWLICSLECILYYSHCIPHWISLILDYTIAYHSPLVANTANHTAYTVKSRQFELGQTKVLGNSNILKSHCKILIISIYIVWVKPNLNLALNRLIRTNIDNIFT